MKAQTSFWRLRRAVFGVAAFFAAAGAAQAQVIDPPNDPDKYFNTGIPQCNDDMVLGYISSKIQCQANGGSYPAGLQSYLEITQEKYRTNEDNFTPRRLCAAKAYFDDGQVRTVRYAIGGMQGWVFTDTFWGYGVAWCVEGLDRMRRYGGNCSALKPTTIR